MAPWHETDFYTPLGTASVAISNAFVAVVGVLLAPGVIVFAWMKLREARGHAAAAKAAEAGSERRVLRLGRTVIHGEVVGPEQGPAIRIRITQTGEERTVKGGTKRHRWVESSRAVEVAPFHVRLATGEQVAIEPDGRFVFAGSLDHDNGSGYGATWRTRLAELRPGTMVYVDGQLVPPRESAAYRGGTLGFTMHAPRSEPMLVSIEPLEARFESRARTHTQWFIAGLALLLIINGAAFGSFWRATFTGRVESAEVVDARTWTERVKNGVAQRYAVTTRLPGALGTTELQVKPAAYAEAQESLNRHEQPTIPVIVAGSDATPSYVGTRPSLNFLFILFGWLVLFVPIFYWTVVRHRRPWYERPKVVDEGAGPLGAPDALA